MSIAGLSSEAKLLLDKAYNLRNAESHRLKNISNQIKKLERAKIQSETEEIELTNKIRCLEERAQMLKSQAEDFLNFLGSIEIEKYELILDFLEDNFNLLKIKDDLDAKIPQESDRIADELGNLRQRLGEIQTQINDIKASLEELAIKLEEEYAMQDKLNEYFDLSLSDNLETTKNTMINFLKAFGFDEKEQRTLARFLMFPEEELLVYENQKNSGETVDILGPSVASKVQLPLIDQIIMSSSKPEIAPSPTAVPEVRTTNPIMISKNNTEITKQELLDYLSNFFDMKFFLHRDIEELRVNFNEDLIQSNIDYIRSEGIADIGLAKNPKLLIDEELPQKIDFILRDLEKEPRDISLFGIGALASHSYAEFIEIKKQLLQLNLNPCVIPLLIWDEKIKTFIENITYFINKGIIFDDKSLAKQPLAFAVNPVASVIKNYDILETYNLPFKKANGKELTPIFANKSFDFVNGLDLMIELGYSGFYKESPEKMSHNFSKIDASFIESLPERAENNATLASIVGEGKEAIGILANQYQTEQIQYKSEIDTSSPIHHKRASLVPIFENIAETVDSNTYSIDGILISKIKFIRNLTELIKISVEKPELILSDLHLIFISALFNSCKSPEEIKIIAAKLGILSEYELGDDSQERGIK